MSPHTKRSAILPNASSFFPPPPTLSSFPSPLSLHLQLFNAPAAAPPLLLSIPPPQPPRPYGRGSGGKSQTRRAAFAARRSPHGFPPPPRTFSPHGFPHTIPSPKKDGRPQKAAALSSKQQKNGARTPRLHPPPARTPSPLLPAPAANPVTTARPLGKPRPPHPPKKGMKKRRPPRLFPATQLSGAHRASSPPPNSPPPLSPAITPKKGMKKRRPPRPSFQSAP